ncbi:MAG: hypothetical protein SCALA702_31920 [Melioribacteraceae bacterium]|nr:MAG: hypothetical protein SCALA702_31920 [Melioribacteraceae bacterium]
MKKLYFFSKSKLKFIEVRSFHRKFVFLIIFFSIVSAFFVFGGYFILDEYINPDSEIKSLQAQNRELQRIYNTLSEEYNSLDKELNELFGRNNKLRNSTKLDAIEFGEREMEVKGLQLKYHAPENVIQFGNIISSFNGILDELAKRLESELTKYDSLKTSLVEKQEYFNVIPTTKPCEGEYGQRFGEVIDPVLRVERFHSGLDIIVPEGTEIVAPAEGVVIFTGRIPGMGYTVELEHKHGFVTRYSHLSKINTRRRRTVKKGEVFALSGNTGELSRGPSLHYEIHHNNIPLDPLNFILSDLELIDNELSNTKNKE